MITFSFDIGLKNLAVCVFDTKNEILEWKLIDLTRKEKKKVDLVTVGRNLKEEIDVLIASVLLMRLQKGGTNNPFLVLLENQIAPKASNMKSIQCMLMQYFIDKTEAEIKFVSSKLKSSLFTLSTSTLTSSSSTSTTLNYSQRKRKAVEICEEMTKDTCWNHLFTSKKNKKDDLADCYLQGVAYMEKYGN